MLINLLFRGSMNRADYQDVINRSGGCIDN
uniref:BRCT domain-containing protein n=1 Tax=Heterorhabditis bacteriophora TaxID=37862 RepID=A0A1I7X729_HETBA